MERAAWPALDGRSSARFPPAPVRQWQSSQLHSTEPLSSLVRVRAGDKVDSRRSFARCRKCESSSRPRQSRSRPSAKPVNWCTFVCFSGDPRPCVGITPCFVTFAPNLSRTPASRYALTITNAASYAETNSALLVASSEQLPVSNTDSPNSRLIHGAITVAIHAAPSDGTIATRARCPHVRLLEQPLGVWG